MSQLAAIRLSCIKCVADHSIDMKKPSLRTRAGSRRWKDTPSHTHSADCSGDRPGSVVTGTGIPCTSVSRDDVNYTNA